DGAPRPRGERGVVQAEDLGGEGVGVGGAALGGEAAQPLDEQAGVGGEPAVRGVIGLGDLDRGGEERAPARARRGGEVVEGVEDREDAGVGVVAAAFEGGVPRGAPPLVAALEVARDEVVLAGEVRVERRGGDLRATEHGVDAGRGDPALDEQLLRGVEQTVACRPACVGPRHGTTVTIIMMKRSLHPRRASSPGRLVAAGTGLIAVTYGVVRYGYGLQLPALTHELGLSSALAGAIAAGSFAAYCAAAPWAPRAMARRSPRAVGRVPAALAASGALRAGASWSAWSLAAGRPVAGSAAVAASPALVAAVASTVDARRAGRAQAVVNAGTGVGVALVGAAALAAPDAWRPVWFGAAAGALVTAAVVDRSARWPSGPEGSPPTDDAGPPGRQAVARPRGPFVRAGVAAAVAGVGSAAVWTFGRDL